MNEPNVNSNVGEDSPVEKSAASALESVLAKVVSRQRRYLIWSRLAGCWAAAALLGFGVLWFEHRTGWSSVVAMPGLVAIGLMGVVICLRHSRVAEEEHRQLASQIEALYPDLEGRLLTAVQQKADDNGNFRFLQRQVIEETLQHSRQHDWTVLVSTARLFWARTVHWLALAFFCLAIWKLSVPRHAHLVADASENGVTVTPGDTSIELGSRFVVLARFGGALPANVELVFGPQENKPARLPLVKSLADPIFGGSLSEVSSNFSYRVEYGGSHTRDYHVTVFEYPRLERADATITYPEYTGLPTKRIENTRRLTAVEGSYVDLALQLNKPVVAAHLLPRDKSGAELTLAIETNRAMAELKHFGLVASKTYELQLVDAEGRTNKLPVQFVFESLTNRAPELHLASPRGDQRPSPLEEITFEGTVWDDFGVVAYGVGYTMPGKDTKYVELGRGVAAKEKRPFKHLLGLEELGLQADQLIGWFVWADDVGPDGQTRRTMSDLFFGEVRPFEEVFREGQGGEGGGSGGQSQQEGGPTTKLAELQKQIINATWKLQREKPLQSGPHSSIPPKYDSYAVNVPEEAHIPKGTSKPTRHTRFASTQFMGLSAAPDDGPDNGESAPKKSERPSVSNKQPSFEDDLKTVQDAVARALEQTEAFASRPGDARTAGLWATAKKEMERAQASLEKVPKTSDALAEALAAEQAAYQALLQLQQHEYQVVRNRNQKQGGGGRQQQMQRQLEQMELTQSENRYENQRQAQSQQSSERREQLQVQNRLQELARRQEDLNERLKELQTALNEARNEQEREEILRRLKRLQEEEQQMLADVDEVQQRMDRPENQSKMAEERKQLDQTRNDLQRASQEAAKGSASQALASGTRAQRQLQDIRDEMRKKNSTQFSEDLRNMRAEARELANRQRDIQQKLDVETGPGHKGLTDSAERTQALQELTTQKERLTNLVDRATDVSQQAEEAEPLVSRQLYDSVRKFAQDSARNVKESQEQLLSRGLMTRNLYDHLQDATQTDGAKLLDLTLELVKQDFTQQARETSQRSQASMEELKRGVEHATESVLGDDTEALRMAQQELERLTSQLQREMAEGENANGTNSRIATARAAKGANGTNSTENASNEKAGTGSSQPQQVASNDAKERTQGDSKSGKQPGNSEGQGNQPGQSQTAQNNEEQAQSGGNEGGGQTPGQNSAGNRNGSSQRQAQAGGGSNRSSDESGANTASGGGAGGDWGRGLNQVLDRFSNSEADPLTAPLTGPGYGQWSDRLRDVEEMIELPELRNSVTVARERARLVRQEYKRDMKKPDWAVVRLQVMKPLVEARDRIADELQRRESGDSLVPIDRDPVPNRYSDLVRRYYEGLGKEK